jgi:photosystem II stability/assembly factor-like uncharacterized protein
MKSKLILCLALVLGGVLFGCSTVSEPPAVVAKRASASETLILEVRMLDVGNGWALAQSGHGVNFRHLLLHTADGGASWTDGTPHGILDGADIKNIYFLDSRHGCVSVCCRKKEGDCLLLTTNGGKSWTQVAIPFHITTGLGCHFFNPDHGIASEADGGLGSSYVRFFETHDGGKNWKPVIIIPPDGIPQPTWPPGTIQLCSMCRDTISYYPPTNVIITHGDMGDEQPKGIVRLSISTNLGESWRDLNLPLPSEKYHDGLVACEPPVFLDNKHGWLPAHIVKENANNTVAWNVMVFYTTDDGGQTWTPKPGIIEGNTRSFGGERQINFVPAKNVFLHGGAHLYVTHNGAKSWQTIKPNIDFDRTISNGGVSQIDFVDARHGWAVIYDTFNYFPFDKYYLYKTSDGGATWMELPLKIAP